MAISLCLKLRHISLLIASTAIRMPKRILRTQHERMTMAVDLFENNRSQLYSQPVLECKEYKLGHGLIFYWFFFHGYNRFSDNWFANSAKNKIPVSRWPALVNCYIGIFLLDTCKVQVTSSINLPFNLTETPFCPAARWSWKLNNSKLILLLHSHHILSYTPANELFNCLYLWGKQTLLRAAPVWSIIKYNATWKCIRHETRIWTSHSDFPPCYPFCVCPYAD